jgi:hypothetical protein
MPELQLTRRERRSFEIAGLGTLRFAFGSRSAEADAVGKTWRFTRPGFWGRRAEATDATGLGVGEFERGGVLHRGGTIRWGRRELALRPASAWRERYALADRDVELAVFDGKSWGRRPVTVSLDDLGSLEPGLVLFTAFVVRGLAQDADTAAAAGSTAATSGS